MRKLIRMGGMAAVMGLAGCASVGNGAIVTLSEADARRTLSAGSTSKVEVRQAMGEATVQTFRGGYEVWVYRYKPGLPALVGFLPVLGALASVVDASTGERELAVLFDGDGIVKKFQLRVAESQAQRLLAK